MKFNKLKVVMVFISGVTLSGCGVYSVKNIDPSGYVTASDYAFAVIEQSGCIGKVDGLFISSGVKKNTIDGLEYIFEGDNRHCSETSFKNLMADYCRSKGGEPVQYESWCRKDDTPIFYVRKLSTLEKNTHQSQEQWFNSALKQGFRSERVEKKKALIEEENRKNEEKEIQRTMNMKVNASIGDSICRQDYDVNKSQYRSRIYYRGFVENKSGSKLKVRIVWHGGENVIINDVTTNPVIWIENKGWFHCH